MEEGTSTSDERARATVGRIPASPPPPAPGDARAGANDGQNICAIAEATGSSPLASSRKAASSGQVFALNFPAAFDFGNGMFSVARDDVGGVCFPSLLEATSNGPGYFFGDGIDSRTLTLNWAPRAPDLLLLLARELVC
jgi:hypothetical protein